MIKLFYSPPKWFAFEAPEKPRQWDYESGGDPPMIAPYLDNGYFYALEAYEKAYAESKANALEVGNMDLFVVERNGVPYAKTHTFMPWASCPMRVKEGAVYDWPGSAVIKDGKYILSI